MRRNRTARVLPLPDQPDRWYAVLYVDGLRSDWTCGHEHLHEVAARACVPFVEAEADRYLTGAGFTEQSLGIAGTGLWSGPVEVLRHMAWDAHGLHRRAFVLGSDRALLGYLKQRALGGRARALSDGEAGPETV